MKFALLLAVLLSGTGCVAQTALSAGELIPIGGIEQYITVQGKDPSLPILLFLHGGPGGSVMNYAEKFTGRLQEHFIVVQWDQRETGRTLQQNASPVPLSLFLFRNDTRELIEFLLKRFQQKKLYLAGHSWGTALGFHIAEKYPELLYAYLPIGPMVNQLESERIALNLMKEKALETGNQQQYEELSRICIPFEDGAQLYYHRKLLLAYSGSRKRLSKSYVHAWASTWLGVFNEASRVNLIETLPSIACPIYFFTGRKDFQTNAFITEKYYTHLTAPKKALFWFENSAHGIPSTEPDRLQDLIIEKVLPETYFIHKPEALIGQSLDK